MANDHSNPSSQDHVRLTGPVATVREMATAEAYRCSVGRAQAQYRSMVRAIGYNILDGLPAFYLDGSLKRLTPDHKYWHELRAYLEGKIMGTRFEVVRNFVTGWRSGDDRPTHHCHQEEVPTNRAWIYKVIIKKTDYAELLRSRGEPMPEWWFAPIEADRALLGKRTDAATATREALGESRRDDLRKFIDGVYAVANNKGDFALGSGDDRKPLPFAKDSLRELFFLQHPDHVVKPATFKDDLQQIGVKVQPGPKRFDFNDIKKMMLE